MKTKFYVCGALLVLALSANAMPLAQAKKELQQELKAVTAAFQKGDSARFERTMAPDFTATDPDGNTLTRDQVVGSFKMLMKNLHDIKWDRKITSIKGQGSSFQTVTVSHLTAKLVGGDNSTHLMVFDSTSDDKWEKSGGHWIDHASKLLKVHSTIDGKPMSMH